jgi:hypothetical protein
MVLMLMSPWIAELALKRWARCHPLHRHAQRPEDALRISAAAFRVNVMARMFAGSTPARNGLTAPVDEHARLAGSGGLRHVESWVSSPLASGSLGDPARQSSSNGS